MSAAGDFFGSRVLQRGFYLIKMCAAGENFGMGLSNSENLLYSPPVRGGVRGVLFLARGGVGGEYF